MRKSFALYLLLSPILIHSGFESQISDVELFNCTPDRESGVLRCRQIKSALKALLEKELEIDDFDGNEALDSFWQEKADAYYGLINHIYWILHSCKNALISIEVDQMISEKRTKFKREKFTQLLESYHRIHDKVVNCSSMILAAPIYGYDRLNGPEREQKIIDFASCYGFDEKNKISLRFDRMRQLEAILLRKMF